MQQLTTVCAHNLSEVAKVESYIKKKINFDMLEYKFLYNFYIILGFRIPGWSYFVSLSFVHLFVFILHAPKLSRSIMGIKKSTNVTKDKPDTALKR